ncbi:MAG TPA: ScpA family protein [Dongiaceae bacterium]
MTEDFEDRPRGSISDSQFLLDLDGYEGPIDVLLMLARDQKVDLKKISILDLADQYLSFVARARRLRLELAADYLVMAAWLAFLKSKLLLPEPEVGDGEPTGAQMAAALAFQLQRLEAMRGVAAKLMQRPQLGREFFQRGQHDRLPVVQKVVFNVKLFELLRAYGSIATRRQHGLLRILPTELYSMDDALKRLGDMLGQTLEWRTLAAFLPPRFNDGIGGRSAMAAMFAASLEMVRSGRAELRQEKTFGPIFLRGRSGAEQ